MKRLASHCFTVFIILVLFFAHSHDVSAQKVTLVLSGGGSWGAGHIGVIRALEENGVPIDCIVGTSAGAIVGGLYSIGYTPDEIEALMSSPVFQRWAEGKLDDENIFYFQNDDQNASWIRVTLDPRKKLTSSLPTNIYSSDQIDFEVMRMFSPANAVAGENFDSLFVPFRCMVSDVSHSRPVIMRSGNLGRAVRGSMSIPFVYQPVVIDSTLYYDGGIYENFPNKAAIDEFHPDIIIGSKVTRPYKDATLDEPVLQVQHLIQAQQPDTIPFSPSVLILPDIPHKVNMLDFTQTKRMADSGYVATIKMMPEIKKQIHRHVSSAEVDSARAAFRHRLPEFIIDSVKILGPSPEQARHLEEALYSPDERMSVTDFEPEYFKLFGHGNISSMFPLASYDSVRKAFDVDIEVHKSHPFTVRIGGNLSFSTNNVGFAELRYIPVFRYPAWLLVNGYFGQSYASLMASGRVYFKRPYQWFVQGSTIYNRYSYFSNTAYFFDVQQRSSITDKSFTWNAQAGFPIGNDALIKAGASFTTTYGYYYLSDLFMTSDTLTRTRFVYFNPSVTYELNKLNRKQYATSGTHLRATVSLVSGEERIVEGPEGRFTPGEEGDHLWFRATGLYEHYFHIGGPFYGGTHLEFNISGQPLFNSYISTLSFCQPFQPLPESRIMFLPGYRAPSWGAAGLKAIVELSKEIEFRNEVYLFQPYRMVEYDSDTSKPYYGGEFSRTNFIVGSALVWNSMLGPLSIGLNYYSSSNDKLLLNINFGYILFNPGRPD